MSNKEPLITIAGLTALVGGGIAVAVEFGLDLTDGQTKELLGLTALVAPFAVALLGRLKVWTQDSVDSAVDGAYLRGKESVTYDELRTLDRADDAREQAKSSRGYVDQDDSEEFDVGGEGGGFR